MLSTRAVIDGIFSEAAKGDLDGVMRWWAADGILRFAKTPQRLLLHLILTSGILSALLVNDTICLMLTPLVVAVSTPTAA